MQYSFITLVALAATGVYARAVPLDIPVLGGLGGVTNTVTDTFTKTTTDNSQKNSAANGQAADQDSKATSTGAQQDNKGDSSCLTKDMSEGKRFCCSPSGNTNTQTNTHSTTSTDADTTETQTDITTVTEFIQFIEQNFSLVVQKVSGFGPTTGSITRRQSTAGSGGDTNSQGDVTCTMSDSCSTEQKNVCFLNGNNLNVGPLGPLVFQKAPQDATSQAGTPAPASNEEATRRRRL
jgi:hypothetical protein